MAAVDRRTDAAVAALIDAVRLAPERRDELLELLPERHPLYDGRSSAEVTRLRGYLLAAFADTGLPEAALPYVLEALESGHEPYEVAGAAIGLRGAGRPEPGAVPCLLEAIRNIGGADAAISFERFDAGWPYGRPTTCLTEVVRTLGGLGAVAAPAVPELERLLARDGYYPPGLLAELSTARDAILADLVEDGAPAAVRPRCSCGGASVEPVDEAPGDDDVGDVALEDQDGRTASFAGFFRGKPSVLAFFYTRCDNPNKCSLTVSRLARLGSLAGERGTAGAFRIAAMTYDPEFDIPRRLRLYGIDRGVAFDDDTRFFRATEGFGRLRRWLGLGVGYGASTVNRHRLEVFVLDADGRVAAAFTRRQWDVEQVYGAVECRLSPVHSLQS